MKELYIQATVEFFSLSSTVQFFPPKVLHSMFIFLKLKNDPYTAGDLNSTRHPPPYFMFVSPGVKFFK